ncbi:dolichol kinase [Cystoisospora suis]|uniref:dolichol kinase n=1 Tax=Cystoisospora suis TaxID=483139 RepID=A0A2C6LI92_9APIC|nr:dolichol kinase [Cystoisospora suis]
MSFWVSSFSRQRRDGSTEPPFPPVLLCLFRRLRFSMTLRTADARRFLWGSCGIDGLLLLIVLLCYPSVLCGVGVFPTFLIPLGLLVFFFGHHVSPPGCRGTGRCSWLVSSRRTCDSVRTTARLNTNRSLTNNTEDVGDEESDYGSEQPQDGSQNSVSDLLSAKRHSRERNFPFQLSKETPKSPVANPWGQFSSALNFFLIACRSLITSGRTTARPDCGCTADAEAVSPSIPRTSSGDSDFQNAPATFPSLIHSSSFVRPAIPAVEEGFVSQAGVAIRGLSEACKGRFRDGNHEHTPCLSCRDDDTVLNPPEICRKNSPKQPHSDGVMCRSIANSLRCFGGPKFPACCGRRSCASSKVVGMLLVPSFLGSCLLYIQQNGLFSSPGSDRRRCIDPHCLFWYTTFSDLVPCLVVGSFLATALWSVPLESLQIVKIVFSWVGIWLTFFDVYPAGLLSETTVSSADALRGSRISLVGTLFPDVSAAKWFILKGAVLTFFVFLQLLFLRSCRSRAGACFSFVEAIVVSQLSATVGVFSSVHCLLFHVCGGEAALPKLCSILSSSPGWLVFVSHMFFLLVVGVGCGLVFCSSLGVRYSCDRQTSIPQSRRKVFVCAFVLIVAVYLLAGQDPDVYNRKRKGLSLAANPLSWVLWFVFSDSTNASLFLFWIGSSLIGIWVATVVRTQGTLARGKKRSVWGSESQRLVISRKVYHLLLVSNIIVGLLCGAYDLVGLVLCGLVWLLVFFEMLRLSRVVPGLSDSMNSFFSYFMDCRDQNGIFLTHIYLALGVTLSFVATAVSSSAAFSVRHLIGLVLVGVGDGAAAVAGVILGGRRFPWTSNKTVAGVIGFFAASAPVALAVASKKWCSQREVPISEGLSILFAVGISSLFEAYASDIDNLTLPLFGLIAYDNAVRLRTP